MIPDQKNILDKIDGPRQEYKTADAARRLAIIKEGKQLGKQLPEREGYCTNCNFLKALPPEHEHGRFCGTECHNEWADKTYGAKRSDGRKSIAEIRRRLGEMAKEKYRPKKQQQTLL